MIACRAGNPDLVRRLVDAGAAINARDHNGRTALMEAACYGEPQTVNLLLASGADRSARTRDGKTAMELARMQGWDEVVAIFS
jgi:ankyrin repeat protein